MKRKVSLWRKAPEALESLLREALQHGGSLTGPDGSPVDLDISLANALLYQRRFREAREIIQLRVEKDPGDMLARMWEAELSFYMGDPWPAPWEKFEARWALTGDMPVPMDRLWDGSPLNGRTVWLAGEAGLGDQIQFVRFAPALKAAGAARVAVSAHETLIPLFDTMAGVDCMVACDASGGPTSNQIHQPLEYDVGLPMMSAPRLLRSTPDTLPAAVPYLHAPAERIAVARRRIEAYGGRLNVGVCWRSAMGDRNIPPSLFYPLAEIPGVRLFGLGLPAQISPEIEGSPILNFGFDEVLDTAAAMSALSLVISVCSMPAHLAGSLARPVWLLLDYIAAWRWPVDGESTPWYPTMRLFHREKRDSWEAVIERMADSLRKLAGDALVR